MYVNILLLPTKEIPIMFECVTTHYQTHQAMMQCVTMTSMHYHMLPYTFSKFNMAWLLCNKLP